MTVNRLKTERGLPALPKLFKDVQFAGHGHEVSKTLITFTLSQSSHRSLKVLSFLFHFQGLESNEMSLGSESLLVLFSFG